MNSLVGVTTMKTSGVTTKTWYMLQQRPDRCYNNELVVVTTTRTIGLTTMTW